MQIKLIFIKTFYASAAYIVLAKLTKFWPNLPQINQTISILLTLAYSKGSKIAITHSTYCVMRSILKDHITQNQLLIVNSRLVLILMSHRAPFGIGSTICTCQEIQCLPYLEFLQMQCSLGPFTDSFVIRYCIIKVFWGYITNFFKFPPRLNG